MRVLLVRLDHMGDIVLTMPPLIAAVRDAYSDMVLDVLTTAAGESLLRDVQGIDRRFVFDSPWSVPPPGRRSTPRTAYAWRSLRFALSQLPQLHRRYDIIIHLSFSPWERLLVSWRGRNRAGFSGPYTRRAFHLSSRLLTRAAPFDSTRHVLDNAFDLVRTVLPDVQRRSVSVLPVSDERCERGRLLLQSVGAGARPLVLIHAGAEKSMKAWPFGNYLEVAGKLEAESDIRAVFIGTRDEVKHNKSLLMAERRPRPLFCPTDSVDELVGVTANADVFIANDGGPMHIAAALGVPTVAVFGPTDERVYGPRGARCLVVRERGICGRRQTPWRVDPCCVETGRQCLSGIEVETVMNGVRSAVRGLELRRRNGEAAIG